MSRFVLDCSVTMSWCFEDQADNYTEKVLNSLSNSSAVVPDLWHYEVNNVLLVAERAKKISPADSIRFLDLLAQLAIVIAEGQRAVFDKSLLSLGRDYNLSSYDAAYLHLAINRGIPLATRDKKLRSACNKSGVKIYE